MTLGEVKELILEKGFHGDSTLYRLQKNNKLRFRIGASLLGTRIALFTNYPFKNEFNRDTYYEIEWSFSSENDQTSYYADISVTLAGSFIFYYVEEEGKSGGSPLNSIGSGFFNVDPILRCGGKNIPLDSVVCQTVLAKLLGSLDLWMGRLLVAKECKYNMIHFTPIQALGASKSAYSIMNQHSLNPTFSEGRTEEATFEQVEAILEELRESYGIMSICDIVLNHTANETEWLGEHPSATYNMINSPHLRPAFLLDRALAWLAIDIGDGKWVERGLAKGVVKSSQDLDICRQLLVEKYIPRIKLEELFCVNVEKLVQQFSDNIGEPSNNKPQGSVSILQDEDYGRLTSTVDMKLADSVFNTHHHSVQSENERRKICVDNFKSHLELLNNSKKEEIRQILNIAVNNIFSGASYERVDPSGPLKTKVDRDNELVAPYFTCPENGSMEEDMELIYTEKGGLCMAHNGWVMGDDPLRNFALPGSNVYLRRELVAWGDSVKLRYGEKPSDSPFLWKYMEEYTTTTAKLFDGIRLDNCHSTPLHVASYMLDAARKVRPDLYIVAELFTGSELKDNIFVNHLGITSLIREGLSAWNSHELGRLVYKYGGKPVGAFSNLKDCQRLNGDVAHALFLDWTHDNPSYVEKRTIEDMLPSAGLVSMASCAVGSNRGYDELVPHHIHVVKESRSYSDLHRLDIDSGILKARWCLSELHIRLAQEGYTEVFVDQLTSDMVAVTRHAPDTRCSVIMVAHTRFNHKAREDNRNVHLDVEGELDQILLQAKMVKLDPVNTLDPFVRHEDFINGCTNWKAEVQEHCADMIQMTGHDGKTKVDLSSLIAGSFVVFSVRPIEKHRNALANIHDLNFDALDDIIQNLDMGDLQFALYQCDQEGKEFGYGTYNIPNYGDLTYCGVAGLAPLLNQIAEHNDLGHPLAANLRNGDWLMDYTADRLSSRNGTSKLGEWLKYSFQEIANLPRYLIPRYFHSVISRVYDSLDRRSFTIMSDFVKRGSKLVESLSRGTLIHLAAMPSAPLPHLSGDLEPPAMSPSPTLAAGLPHFSTGYMRSWGRDTFISLRGLLLTTGQFTAARDILLGYAGCLRHGLIPNLLDGGRNARFNCRDAIWWWLRAVLDYIELKDDGENFLKDPVIRLFPSDVQEDNAPETTQPLHEVINEALTKHWNGLKFREWNAGKRIDEHMTDEGFNNEIGTDKTNGFVFGGNPKNCGTWMDKMGSSLEAGNKGVPSTPRDGSAVEIVGLSYSCLSDLAALTAYPHQTISGQQSTTLKEWAAMIKANFENYFFVGSKCGAIVEPHPDLVNCVNMYKDSVGSGLKFSDYQLRPNFCILLAVAPDLVNPEHAWEALNTVTKRLLGPLGLATLDSADWAYRGDYDNSNQSCDPSLAHGANYHQGPEWLWPVGFFLRALLKIGARLGSEKLREAKKEVFSVLSRHYQHLQTSAWLGLPELTNSNGKFCRDSNPIQAWSHATLLDTLYDIHKM